MDEKTQPPGPDEGFRMGNVPDPEDVEGHRYHGALTDDGDGPDGPAGLGRHVIEPVETDDVEGHRFHGTLTDDDGPDGPAEMGRH